MSSSAFRIIRAVAATKPNVLFGCQRPFSSVSTFGRNCHSHLNANSNAFKQLSRPLSTTARLLDQNDEENQHIVRVAVVLSGCGVYDGSEVHEASAVLVHLSRWETEVSMFAPDINQMHVINHTKGEPSEETRNVLLESARIARGKIAPLSTLNSADFDAVVLPGGFGAAKNLSTFAVDGTNMKVEESIEKVLKTFHAEKKPIGACCIAPVLLAKLFPGCEVTVGMDKDEDGQWPYAVTAGAIEEMGAKHVNCDVTEAYIDDKNLFVTSPAFMCETAVHEVHDGIGEMIDGVIDILRGEDEEGSE